MFSLDPKNIINTDIPLISKNRVNILEDDLPILFYGNNDYDNIILGSIVNEYLEEKLIRYFHTIIQKEIFYQYLYGQISYLEVLNKSKNLYIIDEHYNGDREIYLSNIEEIPSDFLPLKDSYCPEYEKDFSNDYVIRIEGEEPIRHRIDPNVLINIIGSVTKVLSIPFNTLKSIPIHPKIYQKAFSPGSFEVHFSIGFGNKMELFFNEKIIMKSFNEFLAYSINILPNEIDLILGDNKIDTKYNQILGNYKIVLEDNQCTIPESFEDDFLSSLRSFNDKVNELGNTFQKGIQSIEIENFSENQKNHIGFMNEKLFAEAELIASKFDNKYKDTVIDELYKDYTILVYQFNTETRKGKAYLLLEGDIKPKVTLSVLGDNLLDRSIFTESLHENKTIIVKAKAKKVIDKYKSLQIKEK